LQEDATRLQSGEFYATLKPNLFRWLWGVWAMVSRIWRFLTTDVRELDWKQAVEVTKTAADAGKAVLDLGKTIQDKKENLVQVQGAIAPYIHEISSLLDVLNSPIAAVVKDTIPFAPIAVTMMQLICQLRFVDLYVPLQAQ
jgi:hypothetical protein